MLVFGFIYGEMVTVKTALPQTGRQCQIRPRRQQTQVGEFSYFLNASFWLTMRLFHMISQAQNSIFLWIPSSLYYYPSNIACGYFLLKTSGRITTCFDSLMLFETYFLCNCFKMSFVNIINSLFKRWAENCIIFNLSKTGSDKK